MVLPVYMLVIINKQDQVFGTKVSKVTLKDRVYLATGHTRRNHDLKFNIVTATINPYKYSFFIRTIPIWNGLTQNAVLAPSVEAFLNATLPSIRNM